MLYRVTQYAFQPKISGLIYYSGMNVHAHLSYIGYFKINYNSDCKAVRLFTIC